MMECLLIAFTGGETVETNVSVYSEATQYCEIIVVLGALTPFEFI